MSLITRQGKGSKLSIQEMDNNLLYLESLTGMTQAKIGSDTDYSLFDPDGSLRFFGAATTFTDQSVDILSEVSAGTPLTATIFRNDSNNSNNNYAQDYSGTSRGVFDVSGYTAFNTALLSGTFSISFWLKLKSSTGAQQAFGIGPELVITSFSNRLRVISSGGTASSTNTLNLNAWYHACYTQSSGVGFLYLNNIAVYAPGATFSGTIGSGYLNYNAFIGDLCNLRIYNIQLTSNQVGQLYNLDAGLSVDLEPDGVLDSNVLYNIKNSESGGTQLLNSATLGSGHNIILENSPLFEPGPIGRGSFGVYLPSFPFVPKATVGAQRSIRFEMNHNWKTSSNIELHMHISTNEKILSGQTIVFRIEKTIQDIYAVMSTNSLNILNSGKTFNPTSAVTYTFTVPHDIDAYSNLVLDFDNIDMSQFTSVSTCGTMTITRLHGTFTGSIFEIQSIRMHYEIDSTGSRTRWAK